MKKNHEKHKYFFKSKANDILKSSPRSIKELLDDSFEKKKEMDDVKIVENKYHSLPEHLDNSKNYIRLHVHIRQDLADKLLDIVFQRKKNHLRTKKEGSQRAVIEEALEHYFKMFSN